MPPTQFRHSFRILPILLLFWILQSCTPSGTAYDRAHFSKYPPLAEVIQMYYTTNTGSFQLPPSLIRFEKRKEGWFVAIYDGINFNKPIETKQIWAAEDAKYKMLGGALDERSMQVLRARQRVAEEQYYNTCPLFGYAEAAKDLATLLQDAKDLHPEELECLARAYSRLSTAIMAPNQFGAAFQAYDSLFDAGTYTAADISTALEFAQKSIAVYERLEALAPDYPTPVGSAAMKRWNEAISINYTLAIVQHPTAGKALMASDLYDKTIVAGAKNYLQSCREGAILFTWGDNDTYPLLYVQEKLNFRKDVTIVNLSLANMGRYIHYLTKLLPEGQRIATTLDINNYKLDESESFAVRNAGEPIDFKGYLDSYKNNPSQYQENKNGVKYSLLPSYRLLIAASPDSILFTLQSPYLIKSEFFMFDVILTNLGKRPIHFSPGIPPDATAFFNDYLEVTAMTKAFVPKKVGKRAVNLSFSKEVLQHKMQFDLPNAALQNRGEYKAFAAQTSMLFFQIATEMQKQGMQDSIPAFIEFMHQTLPFDRFQYDQYHLYFHQLCMLVQKPALASGHLSAFGNELANTLQRLEADPRLKPEEKEQIMKGLRIHIQTLISTAKADKLDAVVMELENKFTKYLL